MPQQVVDRGVRFWFVYEVQDGLIVSPEEEGLTFVLAILKGKSHVDGV